MTSSAEPGLFDQHPDEPVRFKLLPLVLQGISIRLKALLSVRDYRLDALEQRVSALESRPALKYLGVWAERAYEAGSVVTWDGSMWVARTDTAEKPGTGATAWQLAVKAGRDRR